MKHLLEYLWEKYQAIEGLVWIVIATILVILIFLGGFFMYHYRTIMRCIGYFAVFLLFVSLPACKVGEDAKGGNYLLEVAKAITKENLRQLFPNSNFERDSIVVSKGFKQDFLRKVFHEKVRHFLTPKGSLEAQTQDFYAKIDWERTGEQVKISLTYYKKTNPLQGSIPLPAKRARDGLLCVCYNEQDKQGYHFLPAKRARDWLRDVSIVQNGLS
jgi:hypothetical protein